MGIEIERKFLLKNMNWRKLSNEGITIKQGYLNTNHERTCRVRIKGTKGFLTIKGKSINAKRLEFEYEIPKEDAMQLIKLCEEPIIQKIRYELNQNGNTWEIDVFEGENEGLILAEIELNCENETITIPDWIGKEVTNDKKYFNSSLVKIPFSRW